MRRPGLDALRGFGMVLVLLRHAFPDVVGAAGIAGITMFFVLSGYLITGIVLSDIRRFDRVRYQRFYLHRFFRLGPALFAVLAVYLLLSVAGLVDVSAGRVAQSAFYAVFYLSNLGVDMAPALGHFWTLAVEEQFYVLWPLVLLLAVRRRWMTRVFVVGIALMLVAGTLTALSDLSTGTKYTLPWMWASCILIGCAARVHQDKVRAMLSARPRLILTISVLVIAAVLPLPDLKDETWPYLYGSVVVSIASAFLVVRLDSDDVRFPRVLEPIRLLGLISYACYLWNLIAYVASVRLLPDSPVLAGVLSIVLSILAAVVSWNTVEAMGRRGRARYDARAAARTT